MYRSTFDRKERPRSQPIADQLAHALCKSVSARQSRKQLEATVAARLKPLRARCLRCHAEWPVMLLGREALHRICVVARRSSFLTLRRRIEEQVGKARLACPSCAAKRGDDNVGQPQGADKAGEHVTDSGADVASTASAERSCR